MNTPPISSRPRIALTAGDVAGIGPEVLVRAAADPRVREACDLVAFGHPAVLERAVQFANVNLQVTPIDSPQASPDRPPSTVHRPLPCWPAGVGDEDAVAPGQVDARAGRAAHDYLVAAGRAALAGEIDAVTTAPLNKLSLHEAGVQFPGHTEILADLCGVSEYGMMLYLPPAPAVRGTHGLSVVHVTLHTSIRSVPDLITAEGVREKCVLIDGFLRELGCATPRIGVCALNPHGGEAGLFGDEETRIILPGVEAARRAGVQASDPTSADVLIRRAAGGEFDGVVAMYHDQGHIALKLLGFHAAVNITLGLPIIRTSPSHGTAFDVAWQAPANPEGMIQAILVAAQRVRARARM